MDFSEGKPLATNDEMWHLVNWMMYTIYYILPVDSTFYFEQTSPPLLSY